MQSKNIVKARLLLQQSGLAMAEEIEEDQLTPLVEADSQVVFKLKPKEGALLETGRARPPEELPYYHGALEREAAERLLVRGGSFLLRRDPDQSLILSFATEIGPIHLTLKPSAQGTYRLPDLEQPGGGSREQQVNSVDEFICYFTVYKYPLIGTTLAIPVNRFSTATQPYFT